MTSQLLLDRCYMFLMRDVLHWYDYKVHFDTDTISRNFENLQGSTLNRYVRTDTINRHRGVYKNTGTLSPKAS